MLRRACRLHPTPLHPALKISSISLFLSFFLCVTLRTVIKKFPDFVHWYDWVFEHGDRVEISSFSHLSRHMISQEHVAGIWSLGGLDTSACGISTNSTDMVSEINGHRAARWVWGIGLLLEKPHMWCQEKTQTHSPLWLDGSGEAEETWVVKVSPWTRKLYPVFCIGEFLANE